MPELPEVETLRLQLARLLPGLTIKDIQIFKQRSFVGEKRLVLDKKVKDVRRFAKILVIDLSGSLSLAVHLKMSGQLIYNGVKNKHTRVIITFTNADSLFFHDIRRFGWIRVVRNKPINQLSNKPINKLYDLNDLIKNLGPEPLRDLTREKFQSILKTSKRPIKLVLMDQEKIAGVGNIYANDALFLAEIDPRKKANTLSDDQITMLYHKLLKVLKEGIKWKGASQNNFRDAYGMMGEKQKHFYVYDREGKECINKCGGIIKRITLGGRGTFYCPECQV